MTNSQAQPNPSHDWARDLLVHGFEDRIKRYLTVDRIRDRIEEKNSFGDVLYEAMLGGAGREHFLSMVTYWSIGQGIAVSLRQWMEELIRDLILHPQNRGHFGKPLMAVYTLRDLKLGVYAAGDAVALAGETNTEHSQARRWDVRLRSGLVSAADRIAEDLMLSHEARYQAAWPHPHPKAYDEVSRRPIDSKDSEPMASERRVEAERRLLAEQALGKGPPGYQVQRLICNLVVLEKPPGKVHAFRFASPGLAAIRGMRDEKRNLLMLYGWIRQEKPFRLDPSSVEVYWAHLFPRRIAPVQRHFFVEDETMDSKRFWEYVGIPFEIVRESLETSGRMLQQHIAKTIRQGAFDSVGKQLKDRGT